MAPTAAIATTVLLVTCGSSWVVVFYHTSFQAAPSLGSQLSTRRIFIFLDCKCGVAATEWCHLGLPAAVVWLMVCLFRCVALETAM
jgi:hypothetical protein